MVTLIYKLIHVSTKNKTDSVLQSYFSPENLLAAEIFAVMFPQTFAVILTGHVKFNVWVVSKVFAVILVATVETCRYWCITASQKTCVN